MRLRHSLYTLAEIALVARLWAVLDVGALVVGLAGATAMAALAIAFASPAWGIPIGTVITFGAIVRWAAD